MTSTERRAAAFRNSIEHFIKERLDAKLDKLQADDPKRADLIDQYRRETWLADRPIFSASAPLVSEASCCKASSRRQSKASRAGIP